MSAPDLTFDRVPIDACVPEETIMHADFQHMLDCDTHLAWAKEQVEKAESHLRFAQRGESDARKNLDQARKAQLLAERAAAQAKQAVDERRKREAKP